MGIRSLAALVLALGMSASAHAEKYLVKFKSNGTLMAYSSQLNAARQMALAANVEMKPMKVLSTNAFVNETLNHVGLMVVDSNDPAAIEALRNNPAVAFVEPEIFHPAPEPIGTRGTSIQGASVDANGAVATPWGITAVKAPEAWSTTKGEGARVAVLDTGVDMAHPALASNIEKSKNFNPGEDPNDASDSMGHGTHVAGTVLANGMNNGLVGVAPAAKLLMGKVCGSNGCSSVAISSGINWGVAEGVSVISMSLGGMFISQAEQTALDAAEASNVVVVAASGNDGVGRVSYPAAYGNVVAVGAIDSKLAKAEFSQWGPELDVVAPGVDVVSSVPMGTGRDSVAGLDFGDGKGSTDVATAGMQGSPLAVLSSTVMVAAGLGKKEDFNGVDVNGKIALISRGEITFNEKVANAIKAGAAGVLIYNNTDGLLNGAVTQDGSEVSVPVAMIEKAVGEAAVAALGAGQAVMGSISVSKSDYTSFQGTSMATPHVSGVVALIRAANPNLTPKEVRDILTGTCTALTPNDKNQLGAGIVNAEAAVAAAKSAVPVSLMSRN